MRLSYNRIAGQSAERLAALSDGIFAVAMTLLVLDLRLPVAAAIHGEHDLAHALMSASASLADLSNEFPYAGNFLGWPADAAQSFGALRPPSDLDSPGLSLCRHH